MNLTPDQLAQCRAEFEAFGNSKNYDLDRATNGYDDYTFNEIEAAWIGFQAAWRPRLTVEEVSAQIQASSMDFPQAIGREVADNCARAIARAQGGKE